MLILLTFLFSSLSVPSIGQRYDRQFGSTFRSRFGLPSLIVPIPCQAEVLYEQLTYICVGHRIMCLPGWQNPDNYCRDPACPEGCVKGHGTCSRPNVCKCKVGYYGHACQNCVPLPGCMHGYCEAAYQCKCREGWKGIFCSKAKCSDGCDSERGFCDTPGDCKCHIGWTGQNCTECAVLPGCVNGYCEKPLECVCKEGWTGEFCTEPICKEGCHPSHGSCTEPDGCDCENGYQGELCDKCRPYPGCLHGSCDDRPWTCKCDIGWGGIKCNVARKDPNKKDKEWVFLHIHIFRFMIEMQE